MTDFEKELEDKAKAEKELKERGDQLSRLVKAFDEVLKTHDGRKVLKAILDTCPIDTECFSTDTCQMSYNLGRRSIGIELRQFLKINLGHDMIQNIEKEEV